MNTTLLTQNLAHGKMLFPRIGIGILLMTLAFSSVAQASDSAPNDATIQGSSQVVNGSISSTPKLYYTISEMPGYTSAWNTHVAVYYDSASDANTDTISLQRPSDGNAGYDSIKVKVVVGGISVDTDGTSGYRAYRYNSISNAEYDSSTGKFKRSVEVSRISGTGHFRFSVVSNKGIVRSIATGVMGYETNYTKNQFEIYSDYKLNFGSPCGVPSAGAWQTITLTDPDNKNSSVDNGGAQRRPFTVFVKAQPRNLAGDGSPLERGDYTQLKNITWSGSSNQLSPTYVNETNSSFRILMKPNMKYAFYINGMDNNNTIQVTLPTDEVYHDITCKWWQDSATSRVAVNPTSSTNSWTTYTDTRDTANAVGDRLYFAHQITDPDITRTNYELLVQKQQWWTTNPSAASSGTTGSPTNWNPPGITLDNAFIYNRWWGNDYYYLVKNSVNNGNIKGNPYTITATDMNNRMGSYLCERIAAFPKAGNISGITKTWVFSDPACVMLKFNYSLVPSVTMNQTYINPGGSVSGLGASVRNSAPKPTNSPIANAVVRFVVPKASGSLAKTTSGETSIGNNNDFGCQIAQMMANGMQAGSCKYFRNDSAGFVMRPGVNTLSLTAGTTDDLSGLNLKSGDKVCYFTVINKYEEDKSEKDWRYSAPRCAVVAAIPTVNVWGNDTRTGAAFRDVAVSPTAEADIIGRFGTYTGKIRGSWGEYGVLASGAVQSFASAAGFENTAASASPSTWSRLTFTNTNSTSLGKFTNTTGMGKIPDVQGYMQENAARLGLTLTNVGNQNISGFSPGVIMSSGTVNITSDISNPATNTNGTDIRQMIIIAKNINITSTVRRVDAWLIASNGTINTCSDKTGQLTTGTGGGNNCDEILTITGPLMAKTVSMRRTGGEGKNPAEIYNLRSDTYLWAYNLAQTGSSIRTVSTQELPPRY